MKRIFKVIPLAFIIGLISFSRVAGQEEKSEQRIKVVVADGSDTRIVIDTVFNDAFKRDSITLKDGKVIFIGNRNDDPFFISKDGKDRVLVTVSTDGKDNKKVTKEIIITGSDYKTLTAADKADKIFVFSGAEAEEGESGENQSVIKWSEKDGEESFAYTIVTDVSGNDESESERTKYVITKDGMKISIEGSDYTKVKELANEIEERIDANKDDQEMK